MLGLFIYKVIYMNYQAVGQDDQISLSDIIDDLESNDITNFLKDDANIIKDKTVVEAILLFTYALNNLDTIPSDEKREQHVLTGDFYFSEFYFALSREAKMDIVYEMVEISKTLSSRKSKIYEENIEIDLEEVKYLLFAPLLYLVDNDYVKLGLDSAIDKYLIDKDLSEITYIKNIKGDD